MPMRIVPVEPDHIPALSELAHLNQRERVRARARIMCQQMGKPVPSILGSDE